MLYLTLWIILSGSLFIIPELGLGPNAQSYYSNLIQILSALTCAILCWRTMMIFEATDSMRLVWLLMGAGVFSWCMGQSIYTGYVIINNGAEPSYPWFFDIGYLLIQPFTVIALFIFARAVSIPPPAWGIASSAAALIIALIISIKLIYPNLLEASSDIEYLATMSYMLFDPILLAATVLTASLMAGGQLAYPWWFCFGGLILYYLSNGIFHFQESQNLYVSGSWVDLGWVLSFALIGIAAMLMYNMLNIEEQ